jgi:glycosyltransferase involved in cell wall biosynthesis
VAASISAVVMTLNEERNIDYCLRSVRSWCDEVIVVDMFSDDRTPEIAQRYTDKFLTHERVGFVEPARRMGFAAASGDWILNLDADEVISPELAKWLREFVDTEPPYDVVLLPRANVFLGRWLRSTHWYPGKPRFFRPSMMDTSERIHHGFQPREGARIAHVPKDPTRSMWHFSYPTLSGLTDKMNKYTTIEAEQARAEGRGDPRLRDFVSGPLRAFAPYVVRRGYRDGVAGFAYAMSMVYYSFLATAKRWDIARAGSRQAEYDRMREDLLAGFGEVKPRVKGRPRRRAATGPPDRAAPLPPPAQPDQPGA